MVPGSAIGMGTTDRVGEVTRRDFSTEKRQSWCINEDCFDVALQFEMETRGF